MSTQQTKQKTINLSVANQRGELETLYRWIGGSSTQIKYECSQEPETQWKYICKAVMPNNSSNELETQSIQSKKKDAKNQAAKLMIKEILKQPLPITVIVINEDESITPIKANQSDKQNNDHEYKTDLNNNNDKQNNQNDQSDLKNDDNNNILLEDYKKEDLQPKPTHISSFIAKPFQKGYLKKDVSDKNISEYYASIKNEEYFSCYVYYIKYESDPYDAPIGIILPNKVDDVDLKSIQFAIQIRKNEEKQLKHLINKWVDDEKQLQLQQNSMCFDEKYIHDTSVSIHSVKVKGNKYEHKLKKKYFNIIVECDKFMFETLDRRLFKSSEKFNQYPTLNELTDGNSQTRFYFICPLKKVFSGADDMEIDFLFIDRIYLGSHCKLNAKEFRHELPYYCNLKNELVEIINQKKKNKQIAVSYGVDKTKFETIRKNKNLNTDHENKNEQVDDTKSEAISMASLQSFPKSQFVQNINRLKGRNEKKSLQRGPNVDIMVVKLEKNHMIEDVLCRAKDKKIKKRQIMLEMIHPFVTEVFPTGISTNLWSKLKTMPSILYRIETWFNIIDLRQKLLNVYCPEMKSDDDDEKSNNIPMNIDLKLLFEAMHRSSSTSAMNFQILHSFGSSILKFISTLYLFIYQPTKIPEQKQFNSMNLIKFASLYNFDYDRWNPTQFEYRVKNSLYDLNTEFNANFMAGGHSKEIEPHLMQSIIGVVFISFMQNNGRLSNAINGTLRFLNGLGIFGDINKESIGKIEYITNANDRDTNDAIQQLFKFAISDIKMNDMLEKSLKIFIENNDDCATEGITFHRLNVLGGAALELFVNLFMYESVIAHIYNDQIGETDNGVEKANFSEHMAEQRDRFVNFKSLSYQFVKGDLDKFMLWIDVETRNKIKTYKATIETDEQEQSNPVTFKNGEWFDVHRWALQFEEAPKILAQSYKALLGAIFVGSNPDIFGGTACDWNLRPSIQFVVTFLGNYDNWKEIMDEQLKHILF
eukprot:75353_1